MPGVPAVPGPALLRFIHLAPLSRLADANGDLVLDIEDESIAVLLPVNVTPTLNVAGALMSPKFFTLFRPAGTHAGRLTDVELKVIREWIDIGGQYYNDPFVVPP